MSADVLDYAYTSGCPQGNCAPLDVSQFNPALGSLNSISLNVSATFEGAVTFENSSASSGLFDIQFVDQLALRLPFLYSIQTNTVDLFGDVFPASSGTATYTSMLRDSAVLEGSDLLPYIGVGALNSQPTTGADFLSEANNSNLSGPFPSVPSMGYTLNVNYQYSPAVPEPSFLPASGGLFALLIGLAIRQRKLRLGRAARGRA